VLAGFACQVLRPHELLYQGKPLRFWLRDIGWSEEDDSDRPDARGRQVILALGTNALPTLVKMAGASVPPPWLARLAQFLPDDALSSLHLPDPAAEHQMAACTFRALGPLAKPAVPELARLLASRDMDLRWSGAECLAALGPAARESVPAFVPLLNDTNLEFRAFAADCVARIGLGLEPAVPALVRILQQLSTNRPNHYAVRSAARALAILGPGASSAVPVLTALTNNPAAHVALICITGQSPLPFVQRLGDTTNPYRWHQTAAVAPWLGSNAAPAIPYWVAALAHTNETIRTHALESLGEIHAQPETSLPALVKALQSRFPDERTVALIALRKFGLTARPAVPAIEPFLSDNGSRVRRLATLTLRDIRERQ
jgi:HEAT repeat protein